MKNYTLYEKSQEEATLIFEDTTSNVQFQSGCILVVIREYYVKAK